MVSNTQVLRQLDASPFADVTIASGFGSAPRLDFVPIEQLVIDTSYQRDINAAGNKNICHIVKNFEWGKFSPLLVAPIGNDRFAIIDGQHRATAALVCGIKAVPAQIVDLDAAEQAQAFHGVNHNTTKLTPNAIFKAALAAAEPWAVQCDALVTRGGCRLMKGHPSSKQRKPGDIYCIGAVRHVIDSGYGRALITYLIALRDSSQFENLHLISAASIKAYVSAIHKCGVTEASVISNWLSGHSPGDALRAVDKALTTPKFIGTPKTKILIAQLRMEILAFTGKEI